MYAVIQTGGKQYRVTSGQRLKVESLEAEVGDSIEFDKILLLGGADKVQVGRPYVAGAKVKASILAHGRGKKIRIIKFKRRKHYMKTQGHRQGYTELKIDTIAA